MHYLVIINPKSGRGKSIEHWQSKCKSIFTEAGHEVEEHLTEYAGHASEIVYGVNLDKFCAIICVGGDGNVHEVINGLMSRLDDKNIPIGHVPFGSGNALARNLYGIKSPEEICGQILQNNVRTANLCKVSIENESPVYSFLTQSFGLLTEVDIGTESLRWMGDYRFTWGMIREIVGRPTFECDIFFEKEDGEWDTTLTKCVSLLMGAKMPFISNNARLFPNCQLDDEMLSFLVVDGDISRKDLLKAFLQIDKGNSVEHPSIHYIKTKRFAVVPRSICSLAVDGENLGTAKAFAVKVVPKAIQYV